MTQRNGTGEGRPANVESRETMMRSLSQILAAASTERAPGLGLIGEGTGQVPDDPVPPAGEQVAKDTVEYGSQAASVIEKFGDGILSEYERFAEDRFKFFDILDGVMQKFREERTASLEKLAKEVHETRNEAYKCADLIRRSAAEAADRERAFYARMRKAGMAVESAGEEFKAAADSA